MFVKLHRIKKKNNKFYLSEVRVNVSHILFISENTEMDKLLKEGIIDIGLSLSAKFSDILISSSTIGHEKITVVGEPDLIEIKINNSNKQLLRG